MNARYLIFDVDMNPLAQADLLNAPDSDVLHFNVLDDRAELVEEHGNICIMGSVNDKTVLLGRVLRSRGDRVVVKPGAKLRNDARKNVRVPTQFESYIYPVLGTWRGRGHIISKDLSSGGIAFYTDAHLFIGEIIEIVLPVTQLPLLVEAEILRTTPGTGRQPDFYAAKFIELVEDQDAAIRQAVYSIQLGSR